MVMSFVKFKFCYTGRCWDFVSVPESITEKGFGVLPRAVVWGLLNGYQCGHDNLLKGVPHHGNIWEMANAAAIINGEFCLDKLWIAFAISVAMNTIFAPVFMTFHKITDTHILDCGGSPRKLSSPYPDDPHHYASELGCAMEFCLQENNSFLLVSGTHHHIPPAGRNAGAVYLDIGISQCSGYCWLCGSDEIIKPLFSNDFKQVLRIRYKELLYHFRILRYKGVGYHCDKGIQFCLPLLFSL